jgi:hypothetical protein
MLELKRWIAAAFKGTAEVAFTFPVLFLLAIYWVPRSSLPLWFVLLASCYVLGYTFARIWASASRVLLVFVAVLITVSVFLLFLGASVAGTWIGAVCGFVLFFRGHRSLDSSWRVDFPIQAMWIAVGLYLPAAVIFRIVERLHPYANSLLWLGLATLAIVIFVANETRLRRETNAKGNNNIPSAIRNMNRIWTLLLFLVILLLGSLGKIRDWLNERFTSLLRLISRIFASGDNDFIEIDVEDSSGPIRMPFEEQMNNDSVLMQWFIKIVVIIAVVAFTVFLGFVLYRVGKRLSSFLAVLIRWITRGGEGGLGVTTTGYEDEKENLLNWKDLRGGLSDRLQSWLDRWNEREPKWFDLQDNRERARYLYRLFINRGISRGYGFKAYLTPVETGEDMAQWERGEERKLMGKLGRLYTQARYADSHKELDSRDLDALYQASQKT